MTRQEAETQLISLSYRNDFILGELPTGFGKGRLAAILTNLHIGNGRFLWLVPRTTLIDSVKEELKKWELDHLEGDIICYSSLHLYVGNTYEVKILDEAHNAGSDLRLDLLSKIKTKKTIALSATLDREIKEKLDTLGVWKGVKVSLDAAIESEVLLQPDIEYHYVRLEDSSKDYMHKFGKKEAHGSAKWYYNLLSKNITYWKDQMDFGNTFAKNKMLQTGGKRQQFLADYKEKKVLEILKHYEGQRYICFCGSVKQAQRLGETTAASSALSKKSNRALIDRFNDKEINTLFVKDMLKEGENLVDTGIAFIIQLGNKSKDLTQQIGRVLRVKDRTPQVHIFLCPDTVDDRFLKNSLGDNKFNFSNI